jgi:hypothetical protein
MNQSLQAAKQARSNPDLIRKMEQLRIEFQERRARRVQVIQDLHC